MRYVRIMMVVTLSFFESCTSTNHVQGRYTNVFSGVAGEEFRFYERPNKFEYYSRVEGVLNGYSTGTWRQDKKTIFLNEFDNKNINTLNVENNVEDYPNENRDKIVIQYKDNPLDTFIKVNLVLNEGSPIRCPNDTMIFTTMVIRTLQIKSYLAHEGLLLDAPPLIDTLYSPEIKVANPSKHKMILLKFNVIQNDFYRKKITDILTVRDGRTLLWHNKKFKKIKDQLHRNLKLKP